MRGELTKLATRLLDAWNAHDLDRVEAFYAPQYEGTDVADAAPQRGPREVRQTLARYLQAFPDLRFTGQTIVQDNRIVLFWHAHGTHR